MIRLERLARLVSRTLCLAAVPVVIFAFWDKTFYPLAIKEILIEALSVLAFLCWWVSGGPSRGVSLPNPISRPLLYLCLFALLSILWTPAKQIALASWVTLVCLLLYLPPLLDFGKAPHFRLTYRNTLLAVAMVLLFLSAFQINGNSLDGLMRVGGGNARQRISVTVGHNNGVAPFILAASFLGLATLTRVRSWMVRLALTGFVGTCWILIVFFLLTRSTMIGLVLGGTFLVAINLWAVFARRTETAPLRTPGLLRWVLALSLVVLMGLIGAGVYTASKGGAIQGEYNPNLARNITDRLRTLNPDFLWRDTRARLWAISFHMMKHHPVLGLGFTSAKIDYPFYQATFFEYHPDFPAGPTVNHTEGMHNDYLQWAVECGAVGMVLLVWMLAVLTKITRTWLKQLKQKSPPERFSDSATVIACVALLMDAMFSFPAHIAPLAVCVPGMAMLWFGCVYGKRTQSTGSSPLFRNPLPAWARWGIAAAVWAIVALPLGSGKDHIPLLCRTGIWSPLTAQAVGNSWHTQLVGHRGGLQTQFNNLRGQIESGTLPDLKKLADTLERIRYFQIRCQQTANLIPYAGDAIYDITIGVYDSYQFMSVTRPTVLDHLDQATDVPESIVRNYNRTGEVLTHAENLFRQCLQNYRYHSLYWYLGLIQLERAKAPGLPQETRDSLVASGLDDLATGRRIFKTDERILAEIVANLLVGNEGGAGEMMPTLLTMNPGLIPNRVIPDARRKMQKNILETGAHRLDPSSVSFFRVLLPHLGPSQSWLIQDIAALLEQGGEIALTKEYLAKQSDFVIEPLGNPFWRFRIGEKMQTPGDFIERMKEYREKLSRMPRLPLTARAFYLSDLQRFAPEGTNFIGWRNAVYTLQQTQPGRLPGILGSHMLAQEALERGSYQAAWRWNLEAQTQTNLSNYPSVTGRRPGVVDASLWGITWPWLAN